MNYKDFTSKKIGKLIIAFCICAMLCAIVSIFSEFKFLTNDDWAMMQIASGYYSGYPSAFLCFTNVIIGKCLVFLYNLGWGINWYTFYILGFNFISWVILLYVCLRLAKSVNSAIIVFLILFLLLLSRHFIEFQFTITAALVYVAGLGLLWINKDKFHFNVEVVIGILFIVISGLIRKEVMMQLSLGIAPVIVYQIFKKKYMVLTGIAIASFIGIFCVVYDNKAYNVSPEWSDFKELLNYREHENRYFTYENVNGVLDEIGWSWNDFYLYKGFISDIDSEVFTKENIIYLTERFRDMDVEKDFKSGYYSMLGGMSYYKVIIMLIVLLSIIFVNNKQRLMLVMLYIWTLGICFFMSYQGYVVKERVFFVYMLLWGLFGAIFNIEYNNSLKKLSIFKVICVAMFFCVSVYMCCNYIIDNNNEINRSRESEYKKYLALENSDFQYYAGVIPYVPDCLGIFDSNTNYKLYCLGWFAGIPLNKEKINKNCDNNEVIGVFDRNAKEVLWVFNIGQEDKKRAVMDFYIEHFTDGVEMKEIEEILFDDKKIYKLYVKFI